MGLECLEVLGVKITTENVEHILEEVGKYLKLRVRGQGSGVRNSVNPLIIFTPNPEIVEFAQKDDVFRQIINTAQINIPDGQGICWVINKIQKIGISRVSGTDLMQELSKFAVKERITIGLIGGRSGVALAALECLKKKLPGLKGWATDGPEIEIQNSKIKIKEENGQDTSGAARGIPPRWRNQKEYFSSLIDRILREKIGILFVALGHPKQEYFINGIRGQVSGVRRDKPLVMMGVGGAFDYLSGRVPRAPFWMRERGLEWLYRLIKEPRRWRRQLSGLRFFLRIFFQ